jgi:putative ABC transport system permease protein
MLKSNLTIALRNLFSNRIFSVIHILGLSIGISASLMIYQIVRYEMTFDQFEKDAERIYRVVFDVKMRDMEMHGLAVPAPMGPAIESEVTGVEASVPIREFQDDATTNVVIPTEGRSAPSVFRKQPGIIFTTDSYFEIVPFKFLAGNSTRALREPFGVVLTENRARLYFPGLNPTNVIGKRISYDENIEVLVTGVVADLNEHTDFIAKEFISYSTISETSLQKNFMMESWGEMMSASKLYLKLKPGVTAADTENQIAALMKKNKEPQDTRPITFKLQPLSDIHFNKMYQASADKNVLYGVLSIAAFLMLLACINFINLSTAQATRRMKEICIRKTVGGSRKQLIIQFLGETFLITVLASVLSVGLIPLLMDLFSSFTPEGLRFELFQDAWFPLFIGGLIVVVSFLSGFYPALVISRYRPIAILKSQSDRSQTRGVFVRRTLTVAQFAIAQFFVIAALIVVRQIHFSLNEDMGFRRDAIITIETPREHDPLSEQRRVELYNRLSSLPGIDIVSRGFMPPAMSNGVMGGIHYNNGKHEMKSPVQVRWGDINWIKVYGIQLVAGRNVTEGNNGQEALINENFVHAVGIQDPEEIIGQFLEEGENKVKIVGVMKDFHQGSFRSRISPLAFTSSTTGSTFHLVMRPNGASGTSWSTTIGDIQKIFTDVFQDNDFEYAFYDDTIATWYKKEQNTSALLNWAMSLTVLISCMGLLGLVIYTSLSRTKEIGIRKVLGASVGNLVRILSVDFVKPVLLAFMIAAPLAAWAMDQWLASFAYRAPMSWWIFATAGALLLLAALFTLSFQTVKTALDSPVKSLRNE